MKVDDNAAAVGFRKHFYLQFWGKVNELAVSRLNIKTILDVDFPTLIFFEVGISYQNILSIESHYRSIIIGLKSIAIRSTASLKGLIRRYQRVALPDHNIVTELFCPDLQIIT